MRIKDKGVDILQIVWLGQGGLMLVSQKHKLLIDPYLTNTLKKLDKRMKRRVGIKKKYFKLKPDIILLTNSHPANTDEKTLVKFIKKRRKKKERLTVLSCESSFGSIFSNKEYKRANHIMFGEGDEWTIENMHIKAVKARTNDRSAFGVLVTDLADGKKYYIAANTLYNEEIISSLPSDIFAAFIPISGTYGCMNRLDAQRFATRLEATYVVPINYGMFDKVDPEEFVCVGRVIPKPFKVISFNITPVSTTTQNVFDRKFNEKLTPEQAEALAKSKPQRKKKSGKKKPTDEELFTQGEENEALSDTGEQDAPQISDIPTEPSATVTTENEEASTPAAEEISIDESTAEADTEAQTDGEGEADSTECEENEAQSDSDKDDVAVDNEDENQPCDDGSEENSDTRSSDSEDFDELDEKYSEEDFQLVPLEAEVTDEDKAVINVQELRPPKLKNPNGKRKRNTVVLGTDNPTVITTEDE